MRTRLVATSIVVHLAVVIALFISGFWHISRLEAERLHVDIMRVDPLPEAPAGGPTAAAAPKLVPKKAKVLTKRIVQPEVKPPDAPEVVSTTETGSGSDGSGDGSGTGSGAGSGSGFGSGSGTCLADCGSGSGSAVVQTTIVPPKVLTGMRIAGDAQIHPPEIVRSQMEHEGKSKVTANYKICIDPDGSVSSVKPLRTTGYPAYDERLVAGMQSWRYRPYVIGNQAVTVCSVVTFIYSLQ